MHRGQLLSSVNNMTHIELFVEGAPLGATQPVEVEWIASDEYRVVVSPGLVEGIAAGDIIRLLDRVSGRFEVIRRGGNLSVKFAFDAASAEAASTVDVVTRELEACGGRLDGRIRSAAVWTVPVQAGFATIERVMASAVARVERSGWWYGNVYDEQDVPLGWWDQVQS
jgi:hypothetical protein